MKPYKVSLQGNLSPEWKLLFACAITAASREDLRRIQQELAHANLDWELISQSACQHGIAPLIYYNLARTGVTSVIPKDILVGLKSSYYGNAARNALLYRELGKILRAFKDCGIDVIVLKGAALAEDVYPNRASRPMSDVDLLVRKENLALVEDRLIVLDYGLKEHPRMKDWLTEHHYHFRFRHNEGILIEVHWNIDAPPTLFNIDIQGMWQRAVPARIAGVETLVLSREDLLLHLCHHSACHHALGSGVRPFCDIAERIRRYDKQIDWREVENRSIEWCIDKYVFLALRLARELLQASVPDDTLRALQPRDFDDELFGQAIDKILTKNRGWSTSSNVVRFWKERRIKRKIAVLREILSPEAIARDYSVPPTSNKLYLYYPVRVKDLLVKHGPLMVRLFCRAQQLTARVEREHTEILERKHSTSRLHEWLASGQE